LILLDATALVAAMVGEPAAPEVKRLLKREQVAIVSVNLAESIDILVRVFGNELSEVESRLVPLLATTLPVLSVGESEARKGAEVRIDQYHHRDLPLSLSDCILLGTALIREAAIATSDAPLARDGEEVGVEVLGLKDSTGKRP
jgi:PIN domain nuclease of toxin-antitoxin system